MSIHNQTKTHCVQGHPLTPDNIKKLSNNSGHRVCKTCHRNTAAKYRAAKAVLRKPRPTAKERFFKFIQKTNSCWIWIGARCGGNGGKAEYGAFAHSKKQGYAHRFSYELTNGPIPKGLHIDHLCKNKLCVNPDHLEAVTHRENLMRGETLPGINAKKTYCKREHEFTTENTYVTPKGRSCKICRNNAVKEWYRNKAATTPTQ